MKTKVWLYPGMAPAPAKASARQGAWHFVSLEKKKAKEIKELFGQDGHLIFAGQRVRNKRWEMQKRRHDLPNLVLRQGFSNQGTVKGKKVQHGQLRGKGLR